MRRALVTPASRRVFLLRRGHHWHAFAAYAPSRGRLTLCLLLTSAISVLISPMLAAELELRFERDAALDAILIRAEVNGRPALLLLDTGANRTVISPELAGVPAEELRAARFRDSSPGLHAEYTFREASLRLGSREWKGRRLAVMNLEQVSRVYGRRLDGILGRDVLREFSRVSIDFKRNVLVLSP